MKKFYYYANCKGDLILLKKGYKFTDKNGNEYGASYNDGIWDITELKTGVLVSLASQPVKKKELIQSYIDSKADTVTKLLSQDSYIKLIEKFSELIADYERKL